MYPGGRFDKNKKQEAISNIYGTYHQQGSTERPASAIFCSLQIFHALQLFSVRFSYFLSASAIFCSFQIFHVLSSYFPLL
jgi:hypothetical protein